MKNNIRFIIADYFATGEGHTLLIGATNENWEDLVKSMIDMYGYYHMKCAEIFTLEELKDCYKAYISEPVLKRLNQPGIFTFSQQHYYLL